MLLGCRLGVVALLRPALAGLGPGHFASWGSSARSGSGRYSISALLPGGRLWLVANRHLPYEAALGVGFGSVREVAARDGFKVIEAVRAR